MFGIQSIGVWAGGGYGSDRIGWDRIGSMRRGECGEVTETSGPEPTDSTVDT